MAIKKASFIPKGMQQDLGVSKFNPDYAYENFNIRIVAGKDNNSFNITNERGNYALETIDENTFEEFDIIGTPIGQAVVGKYLVLFTTTNTRSEDDVVIEPLSNNDEYYDRIYRFYIKDLSIELMSLGGISESKYSRLYGQLLYEGNLNFRKYKPIETLPIYENEDIQKVYWTDGFNQPRMINVTASEESKKLWNDDYFNFVRTLSFGETFEITKHYSGGFFQSGVIQYAYAYYSKFGQLSNLVEVSPLYYISFIDRGGKPDETTSNSFEISVKNLDKTFEYIRFYSIYRTSINGTPLVKKVIDLPINQDTEEIRFVDTGTIGEVMDPTELYYIGGEDITVGTFTSKDNTLFLGDININRDRLTTEDFRNAIQSLACTIHEEQTKIIQIYPKDFNINNTDDYAYVNQLKYPSKDIKYFKRGERYRLGIQFQHKKGKWSEPVFISDVDTASVPKIDEEGTLTVGEFHLNIPDTILNKAKLRDYVKVRPLVVYPSILDRRIICQGVVCPTVFNYRDRHLKNAHAQSSWFVRPFSLNEYDSDNWPNIKYPDKDNKFRHNKLVVFKHMSSIPSNDNGRNSEIQCIFRPSGVADAGLYYDSTLSTKDPDIAWEEDVNNFINKFGHEFAVDQSIVTLRSPDIEYDTEIQNLNFNNIKFRIIGRVPLAYTFSDIDLQTSSPANLYNGTSSRAKGFYKIIDNKGVPGSTFCSAPMWLDQPSNIKKNAQTDRAALSSFIIYPFQKTGSLNNQSGADNNNYISAELKYKKLFNLKFSLLSIYNDVDNFWIPEKGTNNAIWNSDTPSTVKIPNTNYNYRGVVDTSLFYNRSYTFYDVVGAGAPTFSKYPIVTTGRKLFTVGETYTGFELSIDSKYFDEFWNGDYKLFGGLYTSEYPEDSIERNEESYDFYAHSFVSDDPIRMRYKSTPHAVISINKKWDNTEYILPKLQYNNSFSINDKKTVHPCEYIDESFYHKDGSSRKFWDKTVGIPIDQDTLYGNPTKWELNSPAVLWLGELYRDEFSENMFGGTSEDAIINNKWYVAGNTIDISNINSCTVVWSEGDTYYQRYDHLNTYPFSLEEENGIIDIVSFMCETRVNIDGRSDRNRSQDINHALTPNNYNLFNEVYNQKDNFFTYRVLDENKFDLNKFPNTVTWTKEKIYGEFVDTWTNITMASTLDLDGNYGSIRYLDTFNNEIISFQDTGIANIIFNPMTQIATTEGLPIELANTGKVQGKRYISENIGCVNKWSIVRSPSGLYFLDNINKAIMSYNGGLSNLSDSFGFRRWAKSELNNTDIWEPEVGRAYAGFYDKLNNDILFINDSNCLAYSESLGAFSSFYSYENVPFVVNFDDKTIMLKEDADSNKYKAWLHNEGRYNEFFGEHKEFYTTVICNESIDRDKIFNTVEYRADVFNGESAFYEYLPDKSFDLLTAETEYQKGYQILKYEKNKPSSLKKKFRIWRADIPRSQGTRDRIRNPWAHITLRKNPNDYNKLVLHDIVVYYTE